MNTALHYHLAGMGTSGAQTGVAIGTSVVTAALPALMGTTAVPTALGSTVAGILGLGASVSAAVPIVGAVIAGISIGIELLIANSGCGQTCIVTSQWANQAEQKLQQNIAAYFAIPAPRPLSVQQIAMANFQALWNTLVQQCSQPGLGTAGQNCIADRKDGGCKWKATAPEYPGEPAAGSCWNWWNAYYYPIANDPNVSGPSISSSVDGIFSGTSGISPMLWIAAAVGGILLVVS